MATHSSILGVSLVAQLVKYPLAMQETWVDPSIGKIPGEGKGYPLQYSGLKNTMYSPWSHKKPDRTERLSRFKDSTKKPATCHSNEPLSPSSDSL